MIEVRDLTKSFKNYGHRSNTLKNLALHPLEFIRQREKAVPLVVVKDLTLTIEPGEVFCVVGRNGCGKSTLAKLFAGTMTPDRGSVHIRGKVVPYLELGVAFSPELTGRENVMLNGVLLGLGRKYLKDHMDDIFDFAEISGHRDTPLKFYSSGMVMRLAFAIGLHVDGDVYIFDEILSVGDAAFATKCQEVFAQKLANKKTIVHITHDLGFVQARATTVLLLSSHGNGHRVIRGQEMIREAFSAPELLLEF